MVAVVLWALISQYGTELDVWALDEPSFHVSRVCEGVCVCVKVCVCMEVCVRFSQCVNARVNYVCSLQ